MKIDYRYHICGADRSFYQDEECDACQVWHDRQRIDGFDGWIDPTLLYARTHHAGQEWSPGAIREFSLVITDGNDEPSFTWIVRLAEEPENQRPPRWAAIRGWHDYTGWDCRSGLRTEFYATEADAFRTLVDWERELLQSATATWPAPLGFAPITASQEIEREDGEYSREEYR